MPEVRLLDHFYLKVDGTNASEELMQAVLELTVESSLHLPDVATILLQDPQLHWLDDPKLAPGKSIEVAARSETARERPHPLFEGEIVEVESEFGPSSHHLVLRAFDVLHRLARGRRVRSFQNVTDSDVVERVARDLSLRTDVDATTEVHPYLLQNNETNLEFLRRRAKAAGRLLYADGRTLCFKRLAADPQPVELRWGDNLSEFRPRLTTVAQVNRVTARGWDPHTRTEIIGEARAGRGAPSIGETSSGGEVAQRAFGIDATDQISSQPLRSQASADLTAQAVADRQAERFIQAEGACRGDPRIVAGASIRIESLGTRFSGTYAVTTATHRFTARESYTTHFGVSGQTPSTLGALLGPEGEVHPLLGGALVIGLVTDNQDPRGCGMVKVRFPWLSGEHTSDWARVVAPGAGAERGLQFLPEVNDEVLVGFEMGDVHHPFVIGGLWNGRDAPPRKSSEIISAGRVQQRIIRSRLGHRITLDDSEDRSGIVIEDPEGNRIALDSKQNKLVIEVEGDVAINAGGNLRLEAQGRLEIKANATVDVTGTQINLN